MSVPLFVTPPPPQAHTASYVVIDDGHQKKSSQLLPKCVLTAAHTSRKSDTHSASAAEDAPHTPTNASEKYVIVCFCLTT